MASGANTVVTATEILLYGNTKRISHLITNQGPSTVFLGAGSSLTTVNGISLASGSNLTEDSGGDKMYQGEIWAVSVSESNLRYWERERA